MISIIIPVYNSEKYIAACLDSVLAQKFTDFECLCINDGSTDKTPSILKQYSEKDPRIKVITKANGGISSARNAGIDAAKGQYLYFMDNDDFITPDYLENMHNTAKESGCPLVVNPNISFYYSQNEIRRHPRLLEEKIYEVTPKLVTGPSMFVVPWNKLYKTALVNGINLRFPLNKHLEDAYFYYCLMPYVKEFAVTKKGEYFWRKLQTSATKTVYNQNNLDMIEVFELIKEYYRKHDLEKKWQVPILFLRTQFTNMPDRKLLRKAYDKTAAALKDSVIHYDVISDTDKKFIRNINKGYLYVFWMIYMRKNIKKRIKNFLNIKS